MLKLANIPDDKNRFRQLEWKAREGSSLHNQEEMIEPLPKAEGWIFNKLMCLRKILLERPFDPSHPLMKECSNFMDALYAYSPAVVSLGTYLLHEALKVGSEEEQHKTVKRLSEIVKSQNRETLKEKVEAGQMAELLEGLIEEGRREQVNPEFSEFLKVLEKEKQKGDSYILAKIKEGTEGKVLSKEHPLYEGILRAIKELQRCPPDVQEWSIYLFQQLLEFPPQSKQARVILDYIESRVASPEFKKLANPEDPDALNLGKEELNIIGKQIEATLKRKQLLLPSEVPQNLKVSLEDSSGRRMENAVSDHHRVSLEDSSGWRRENAVSDHHRVSLEDSSGWRMENAVSDHHRVSLEDSSGWRRENVISDPHIALHNYLLEEDKKPFNQDVFNKSVEDLVSLFNQYIKEKKITDEMRIEDENDDEKVMSDCLAEEKHLRDLLTNRGGPSNRFANRVIRIRDILWNKLDEGTQIAQLASWPKAGFRCTTRSEEEISKFYTQNISEGLYLEGEEDTLEMRIALLLARYREQLLEKIVPQETKERVHQILFLKKHAQEGLELIGGAQDFEDKFEKLVERRYRNMVQSNAASIRRLVMEGGDARLISKGEGYKNPDKMIEFVFKQIHDDEKVEEGQIVEKKKENIATKIRKRFQRDYGETYAEQLQTYYDEDYKLTKDGVRALLYSLGYLENNLELLAKK